MDENGRQAASWLDRLKARMATDFQFAMIVVFGLVSGSVIAGFAVFRLLSGNPVGAGLNAMISTLVLGAVVYAIATGRDRLAGIVFVTVITLGAFLSTLLIGTTGLSWSFLAFWINFVLTERRIALSANLAMLLLIGFATTAFDSTVALATYLITGLMITAFAFVFAKRLTSQQTQLERMASRDPLTNAGNRRSLQQDLLAAVADYQSTQCPYVLMMLDLDHFKALNDRYGHEAGDKALRDFGALVPTRIRRDDGFYRFGGEEFVILFRGLGADRAETVTEAVHANTSGAVDSLGGKISFSAGVALLRDGQDMDAWLAAADQALYRAKAEGRNRVRYAPGEPAQSASEIS